MPLVKIVTLPSLLSEVALRNAPQLGVIELIDGVVLSYMNVVEDSDAALPAESLTFANIVFVPSGNTCRSVADIVIVTLLLLIDPV